MESAEVGYISFREDKEKWNIWRLLWEERKVGHLGFGEVIQKWSA